MKTDIDVAQGWMLKAKSDLKSAELLLRSTGPFDTACFHAQQAAEKSLKAVLCFHGIVPPRTHDMGELAAACIAFLPDLSVDDGLLQLTEFAVGLRYDASFWPDRETAEAATRTAAEVLCLSAAAMGRG